MRRVYKYPLLFDDPNAVVDAENKRFVVTVQMPEEAVIVHVGEQRGTLMAWAVVDPDVPLVDRVFHIVMTGGVVKHEPDESFAQTVLMSTGIVVHVFCDF